MANCLVILLLLCVTYLSSFHIHRFGLSKVHRSNTLLKDFTDILTKFDKVRLQNPVLSQEQEIRLFREYQAARIVDEITRNISIQKNDYATLEEVATVLGTTPEVIKHTKIMGDAANHTLVRCNRRLLHSVVKKFEDRGLGYRELMDAAEVGLVKGIEQFQDVGYRLSTYVMWYIKAAIYQALARNVGLSVYEFNTVSKWRRMRHKLMEKGIDPDIYRMAEAMKMTIATAEKYERLSIDTWISKNPIDMDALVYPTDSKSTTRQRDMYYLHDPNKNTRKWAYLNLRKILWHDEYEVIIRTKGYCYAPSSIEEVADELDMTVEEVIKLERSAEEKLKLPSVAKYVESIPFYNREDKFMVRYGKDFTFEHDEDGHWNENIGVGERSFDIEPIDASDTVDELTITL